MALYAGDGDDPLTLASVTVGGTGTTNGNGQDEPTPEGDVLVFGTVNDGDSGQPIMGAYFVVLQSGLTYDEWDGSEDAIYTFAETDAEGAFVLPFLLEFDTPYTIVVGAEGYQTKFGDDLVWTTEDPVLYNFEVDLVQ